MPTTTKSPVKAVSYMNQVIKRFESTNERMPPTILAKLCKAIVAYDLLILPVSAAYGECYVVWDVYTDLPNPEPEKEWDDYTRTYRRREVWYKKHKQILCFDGSLFTDKLAAWNFLHPVMFGPRNKELLAMATGLKNDYDLVDDFGHYEY